MGAQQGWLGDSLGPFLQFIKEALAGEYDWIVIECVVGFDHATGLAALLVLYTLVVIISCPTGFGVPNKRRRKYMLLTRNATMSWLPFVKESGAQVVFDKLFTRSVQIRGDLFARASSDYVDSYISRIVAKKELPKRRSGKPWNCFQVLPPGMRSRVKRHEGALKREKPTLGKRPPYIANVAQNLSHSRASVVNPALLRQSALWSMRLQRLYIPLEHFEVQGYSVFSDTGRQSSFAHALPALDDNDVLSLAGNGMHLLSISCSLAFLLACTACR